MAKVTLALTLGVRLSKPKMSHKHLILTVISFLLAILEWTISFGYTLYLLTFAYDLHMSKGRHKGELTRDALMTQQVGHGHQAGYGNGYQAHGGYRPSTDTHGTSGAPPMGRY
jgi:hypothetical protein